MIKLSKSIFRNKMTEVIFRDSAGELPQIEIFDQLNEFGGYSIGKFVSGGTGFLIKVDSEILIATACHFFIDSFQFIPKAEFFFIDNQVFTAVPKKKFIEWTDHLIDPLSGIQLSIPEDWIICSLISPNESPDTTRLVPLEICLSQLENGFPVKVVGYPSTFTPKDLNYSCPTAKESERVELANKINCFRNQPIFFDENICASGNVICATCCSANGMSGAPLLIKEGSRYYAVGLLHGSKPTMIHYLTASLIVEFSNEKLSQLVTVLQEKLNLVKDNGINRMIKRSIKDISNGPTKIFIDTLDSLYDYSNLIESDAGNGLSFNVFVSLKFL